MVFHLLEKPFPLCWEPVGHFHRQRLRGRGFFVQFSLQVPNTPTPLQKTYDVILFHYLKYTGFGASENDNTCFDFRVVGGSFELIPQHLIHCLYAVSAQLLSGKMLHLSPWRAVLLDCNPFFSGCVRDRLCTGQHLYHFQIIHRAHVGVPVFLHEKPKASLPVAII